MRVVNFLVRWFLLLGIAGVSFLALGALFGFAAPLLDVLNHFQPFLFAGTLTVLATALLGVRIRLWRKGVVALAVLGFASSGVTMVPELASTFVNRPGPTQEQRVIKLLSHNLFGVNWQMELVAAEIAAEGPDILVFQEYFRGQYSRLHGLLIKDYPYFYRCGGGRRAFIAIYAKWPFELTGASACPRNVPLGSDALGRIAARFELEDGRTFSVMTTQLNWPIQVSPLFNDELSWPERFKATYARQAGEMSELAQAVRSVEEPLVLVGDFNSTPWSYALRKFVSEAGLSRQTRNMMTYPTIFYLGQWVPTWPFLPIDHMMSSPGIVVHNIKTGPSAGSDHLSVIAEFSVSGG
ncbi:MAG TPA: hypothetical protein ENJ90_05920 [Devosia sp.]|nr:hypothetical protein [Devosia sp.]